MPNKKHPNSQSSDEEEDSLMNLADLYRAQRQSRYPQRMHRKPDRYIPGDMEVTAQKNEAVRIGSRVNRRLVEYNRRAARNNRGQSGDQGIYKANMPRRRRRSRSQRRESTEERTHSRKRQATRPGRRNRQATNLENQNSSLQRAHERAADSNGEMEERERAVTSSSEYYETDGITSSTYSQQTRKENRNENSYKTKLQPAAKTISRNEDETDYSARKLLESSTNLIEENQLQVNEEQEALSLSRMTRDNQSYQRESNENVSDKRKIVHNAETEEEEHVVPLKRIKLSSEDTSQSKNESEKQEEHTGQEKAEQEQEENPKLISEQIKQESQSTKLNKNLCKSSSNEIANNHNHATVVFKCPAPPLLKAIASSFNNADDREQLNRPKNKTNEKQSLINNAETADNDMKNPSDCTDEEKPTLSFNSAASSSACSPSTSFSSTAVEISSSYLQEPSEDLQEFTHQNNDAAEQQLNDEHSPEAGGDGHHNAEPIIMEAEIFSVAPTTEHQMDENVADVLQN